MIQSKPSTAATSIEHREFNDEEFWKEIPGWKNVTRDEFGDHHWQSKSSIRKLSQVKEILGDRINDRFIADIEAALKIAPMNIRITPYVFSLIDWDHPVEDPLRMQFLPIASQMLDDHLSLIHI